MMNGVLRTATRYGVRLTTARWTVLCLALSSLIACSSHTVRSSPPDEELVVYAAVIDQVLNRASAEGVPVAEVTLDYTGRDVLLATAADRVRARLAPREETIAAFAAANTNRRSIPDVPSRRPVPVVADSVSGFGGRTRFSRAGIAGNEALLEVNHACGPVCGHVSHVLLRKEDGLWRVVGTVASILR